MVINIPDADDLSPDQVEQCYLKPMVAAAVECLAADRTGRANVRKTGKRLEDWLRHTTVRIS